MALDHIDLTVGDLARSVDFYDRVLTALGFTQVETGETVVWRDGQMEIGIRAAMGPNAGRAHDRYTIGLHHLAFRAQSRADVDRFHRFLMEAQIPILDPPAEYPQYEPRYYAVFFSDPDGMKLELAHRPSIWQTE